MLPRFRPVQKSMAEVRKDLRIIGKKVGKQVGKDYIVFPALTGPNWKHTLGANAVANLIRNYWSYMVIFCGHFPDGAEEFTGKSTRMNRNRNGISGRCSVRRTFMPVR